MPSWDYRLLDVFTTRPFEGNPLAVFPDGRAIDDATMQRIARELNLSETVFVLPPRKAESLARLRIFTPTRELPFAGHPTVGTASTLLRINSAATDRFSLEEEVGDVPIRVDRSGTGEAIVWLTTPPVAFGATVDRATCAKALNVNVEDVHRAVPQYLTAGSPFLYVALTSSDAVDRARYERSHLPTPHWPDVVGIFVFSPQERTVDGFPAVYSRMFAPESGIPEDPATGGATGPLAAYIMKTGLLPREHARRFISEQGTKMGRRSLLHVCVSGDGDDDAIIEIGGQSLEIGHGTLHL